VYDDDISLRCTIPCYFEPTTQIWETDYANNNVGPQPNSLCAVEGKHFS